MLSTPYNDRKSFTQKFNTISFKRNQFIIIIKNINIYFNIANRLYI